MPITTATVGGDDQLFGLWIALTPHAESPATDGLHGEGRGVMVCASTHPSLVSADIVDPVGVGPSEFFVDEVVNFDLHGLAAGEPLLSGVLVRTHQLLLLCVHRNHGLIGRQGFGHRGVDVLELSVAIRALITLDDLGVGLQAVVLILEELTHYNVTHRMAARLEFIGQRAQALASPAQWRLWVAAGA